MHAYLRGIGTLKEATRYPGGAVRRLWGELDAYFGTDRVPN